MVSACFHRNFIKFVSSSVILVAWINNLEILRSDLTQISSGFTTSQLFTPGSSHANFTIVVNMPSQPCRKFVVLQERSFELTYLPIHDCLFGSTSDGESRARSHLHNNVEFESNLDHHRFSDALLFLRSLRIKPRRFKRALEMIFIILLAQGVESNPGPGSLKFGCLNIQSAVRKAALIHDIIDENKLDILILNETWIVDEDPPAIKLDVAPPGYCVYNTTRPNATRQNRGGGLACISKKNIQIRERKNLIKTVPKSFEYQLFELQMGKLKTVLCNIYRPPSGGMTHFYDEFADFIEIVNADAGDKLVVAGDFNCPGALCSVDDNLTSVFDLFDLIHRIKDATRINNIRFNYNTKFIFSSD